MIGLYFRLIGSRIRSQMQYKLSFVLELVGFMLLVGVEFVGIAVLLTRFQSVGGWRLEEVALLYGLTSCAFSLAEMAMRGFDFPFETMMQKGTFDIVLIRPHGTFFQVLTADFQLRRLGRTLQALIVLTYGLSSVDVQWTLAKVAVLPISILSGFLIYAAIIVISATICFWTVQMPEVVHVFTGGGEMASTYPPTIYGPWLRSLFLFIVPLCLANYPAVLLILGRSDPLGLPTWSAWAAPLVAVLFFSVALAFWRFGVRRYQGAGG